MKKVSHSLEDYLEAILLISKQKKVVRVKDIVNQKKVRTPSVIGALKKLEQLGYVEHEHYGYIELTEAGYRKAEEVYEKHKILYTFLTRVLKIDERTAENDACQMEHYLSKKTFENLVKLYKFLAFDYGNNAELLEKFQLYLRS